MRLLAKALRHDYSLSLSVPVGESPTGTGGSPVPPSQSGGKPPHSKVLPFGEPAQQTALEARPAMQNLVEDFLSYLRHERGCSPQTEKTYAALLLNFVAWAARQGLKDWPQVTLSHLMAFMEHERTRALEGRAARIREEAQFGNPLPANRRVARLLFLRGGGKASGAKPRRKPVLPAAVEAAAQMAFRCGNRAAAQTGNDRRPARPLRSGGAGTGLRLRLAPGRIARHPPGAASSGRGLCHRHWQRQQGARGAAGAQGGGGDPALPGGGPPETGDRRNPRPICFSPGAARLLRR